MNPQQLKRYLKKSQMGRFLLVPYRFRFALSYYSKPVGDILRWTVRSREHANLTYDLEPLNEKYLAAFIATVTRVPIADVTKYLQEIQLDQELKDHIRKAVLRGPAPAISDTEARYGRRIGWYALIRALKPKVVVETGVEKGLGSCVIAAALKKNASEGFKGRAYGTDINPDAGYLLHGTYAEFSEVLYGDSIESLRRLEGPIDLFINDSDHSADYEWREYQTVAEKMSPGGVILGDNAHLTDKLFLFAQETGRDFLFFQEKPRNHWYPGGGIGVAFSRVLSRQP